MIWGSILICFGCTFLLINLGYLEWSVLHKVLLLWPILLIVIGIEHLVSNTRFHFLRFLTPLIILGTFFLVILKAAVPGEHIQNQSSIHFSQPLDKNMSSGEVLLESGTGNFFISGGTSDFLDADLSYYDYAPKIENNKETLSDTSVTQKVNIQMEDENFHSPHPFDSFNRNNLWKIKLTNQIPINIDLNTGACKVNMDMSTLKIESLNMNVGVGEIKLKFSDLLPNAKVNINGGVSKLLISVPKTLGVKVLLDNALSENNLKKLRFTKGSDECYYSPDYSTSVNKIEIDLSLGVSRFTLTRY
ncbi:MAG: toast rack family protein [bacterium]|nr:toast rack family protein [bacterium]